MNNYEGLFIIKPDLKEDDIKNVIKAINDSITKHGGNVKKEENWGRKQLAYPVNKFKEGYYYKVDFEGPSNAIIKLEGAYKLNSDILRAMMSRR